MEVPALAINGVTPVLSPILLLFLGIALAGASMLIASLLKRNLLLVTQKRLSPTRADDLQKAGDPTFYTRPAGTPRFFETGYARLAVGLVSVGSTGVMAMLLWALFSG